MILKISLFLVLNVIWLHSVWGASFSKVFVQSGADVGPVEYIQYGAPSVSVANSQFAQISAAPIGSVVPLSSAPNYVTPCGTPCVYPGASVISSASPNYVTYKSSVPVVVASQDEQTGYEYSYIVYDDNTGDHKSQHEHSDGSVVRGEYSLIQPDGYVREVQYVADDLKGFNAIVKNFLPSTVVKKVEHKENKDPGPPCHEVKNEPLKHAPDHHEEKSAEESSEISSQESKEKSSAESKEKSSDEIHAEKSSEENKAEKSSEEHSKEKPSEGLTAPESHEEKSGEENKDVSHEEHSAEPAPLEHKAEHSDQTKESHEENKHESNEPKEESSESKEELSEEHNESHEKSVEPAHKARADNQEEDGNVLVSYNDIIKCVQSAIRNANAVSTPHHTESPLTYIILNKPC